MVARPWPPPGGSNACGLFCARHPAQVRVVASLPCYSASNVDKQRGNGVFERSIEGLKLLNAVGYGVEGSGLVMDLVYNPGGWVGGWVARERRRQRSIADPDLCVCLGPWDAVRTLCCPACLPA